MHYSTNSSLLTNPFIATYDVQSIDTTNGQVCATFIFTINTIAIGVEIQIN